MLRHGDVPRQRSTFEESAMKRIESCSIESGSHVKKKTSNTLRYTFAIAALAVAPLAGASSQAEQPPPPCHAHKNASADVATVRERGDVRHLPDPLVSALTRMASRPHSALPTQAFAEADGPSQLFQYYLLGTDGFEPNVFTTTFPGVNDQAMLTATGPDCGLPTIGTVRVVLEPKPDLPTDPNDVRAFIDIFTDISGLFVINNESGWYEGWMIHDLSVPDVAPPRADGHAQFGKLTADDALALHALGGGHNVAGIGAAFTMDGQAVRLPSNSDHFPDVQTNVVPIQLSMGAWNTLQQGLDEVLAEA
jgi:hypothetical protein